jgi:hypothetical protein
MRFLGFEICSCINYVDDKDLHDLTVEEQTSLLERLLKISNMHGMSHTINLLLDNIEYEGEDGGYCDDSVYRQLYDLDDFDVK